MGLLLLVALHLVGCIEGGAVASAATASASTLVRRGDAASNQGATHEQVELAADGKLVDIAKHQQKSSNETGGEEEAKEEPHRDCNEDFVLGVEKTNDCKGPDHQLVAPGEGISETTSRLMCEHAAELAGAKIEEGEFDIAIGKDIDTNKANHPIGCFMALCGSTRGRHNDETHPNSEQTPCYYYNPYAPQEPDKPLPPHPHIYGGTPVCFRDRYKNGTTYTHGKDAEGNGWVDGSCPAGYQRVVNEEHCRNTATCLGRKLGDDHTGESFKIGESNWTKHRQSPLGCFLALKETQEGELVNGAAYLNREALNADGERMIPDLATGIPLCNVSMITKFPGDPELDFQVPS